MRVLLERGHALSAADFNGLSDPYAKVTIGALGLEWTESTPSGSRPEDGEGLHNQALESALRRGQFEFSRSDFWRCGVEGLKPNSYIEVDGRIFVPRDTRQELRTKTHPRSCDPEWDEELLFEEASVEDLLRSGLTLEIFDADRFTRDDFLGGVHVNLDFLSSRDNHSYMEPLYSRPIKWKEARSRGPKRGAVEVPHPRLRDACMAKIRRSRVLPQTFLPAELQRWGIEHCGKHAYCWGGSVLFKPDVEAQGTVEFRVQFYENMTSINEEIASLTDNVSKASAAFAEIGAAKVALKAVERVGLRLVAESLHLDGTSYDKHPKETLAAWAKKHVKDGLGSFYDRCIHDLQNEMKSDIPRAIAGTATDLFHAFWCEVRDPMTDFLEEEFDRAIGVVHHDWQPARHLSAGSHHPHAHRRRTCFKRFRIAWLRAIYPHDRSYWKMIKNPTYLPLFFMSVFPFYGVSPLFWVTNFLLIERRDEFQLAQFICQFKGLMAFTTGLVGILTGAARSAISADLLLGCLSEGAVGGTLEERLANCPLETAGGWIGLWPGGYSSFWWDMGCWLLEVFTVWTAFALLPFSNDNAVGLRKTNRHLHADDSSSDDSDDEYWTRIYKPEVGPDHRNENGDSTEEEEEDDEEAQRSSPGPPSLRTSGTAAGGRMLPHASGRTRGRPQGAPEPAAPSEAPAPTRVWTVPLALPGVRLVAALAFVFRHGAFVLGQCVIAAATALWVDPPLAESGVPMPVVMVVLVGVAFHDYVNLLFKTLSYLMAVALLAVATFLSVLSTISSATPMMLALALALAWFLGPALNVRPNADVKRLAACGRGGQCAVWGCPALTLPCWMPCCALWCCKRWPVSPFTSRSQRRGGLLRRMYDFELGISTVCAAFVSFEGVRMLLRVAPGEAERADMDLIALVTVAYSRLGPTESLQYRAILFWTRVVYGLLSLPFVVFTIPFVFEALSHSRQTGYDRRGHCVRQLSAYERPKHDPLEYEWKDVWRWCQPWKKAPPELGPDGGISPDGEDTDDDDEAGKEHRAGRHLWKILRRHWRLAKDDLSDFARGGPTMRYSLHIGDVDDEDVMVMGPAGLSRISRVETSWETSDRTSD